MTWALSVARRGNSPLESTISTRTPRVGDRARTICGKKKHGYSSVTTTQARAARACMSPSPAPWAGSR
ncbi:hypothetical protein D3C86_928620 [compost metagenome]